MCVTSLTYPACNGHAPYCHLWPDWLYHIFPHYVINGTILGKKVIEIKKCVFDFLQPLSEKFLTLKAAQRDTNTTLNRPLCKALSLLSVFNQACFFSHVFEKFINIIFNENSSTGIRIVQKVETDGRTLRS